MLDEAMVLTAERGVARRRKPAHAVVGIVAIVLVAFGLYSIGRNPRVEWKVVGHYLFESTVLHGLWTTLWLTGVIVVISSVLGTIIAIMRMSTSRVLQTISWTYIWVFRATPLLVQLLFWFNIGYLYPEFSFGVPFGPTFIHGEANSLITPIGAALVGFTLHEASYTCEIIRGGVLSVPKGQTEAGKSLGIGASRRFVRIIMPQAMRAMIPPLSNQVILVLKATSLASVVSVPDLLFTTRSIYETNYKVVPLLVVATLWYLAITSVLSIGQHYVARYYSRGHGEVKMPKRGLLSGTFTASRV
jgi:polar amino acid transport system permease protein